VKATREGYPPHLQRAIAEAERHLPKTLRETEAATAKLVEPLHEAARALTARGIDLTIKYRSKLEQSYGDLLALQLIAKEIAWWAYEPWRFKLADGAWYKVDFGVMLLDGSLEAREVKGFWREAARLRIKVASSLHPLRFKAITRSDGAWIEECF